MSKTWKLAVLLTAGLAATGCHRKAPGGQVAAVVNGKEITLQEINTELRDANIPDSVDKQAAQRGLLQRVIERKLLVGAAEDKKLDKTTDYQAAKRRADELLLAQTYAKQQLQAVPVPTQADIDKFMADNPQAFGKREQLTLDQIRFATPPSPALQKQLQQDHSLDAVAATLAGAGIKFDRARTGLDSAAVPPKIMSQIDKLPATEPFVVPANGVITVNTIVDRKPVPVDAAKSRSAAVNAWRQQKYLDLLNKQLTQLKQTAKISYQPGFAPTDKPAATPAAAATPAG